MNSHRVDTTFTAYMRICCQRIVGYAFIILVSMSLCLSHSVRDEIRKSESNRRFEKTKPGTRIKNRIHNGIQSGKWVQRHKASHTVVRNILWLCIIASQVSETNGIQVLNQLDQLAFRHDRRDLQSYLAIGTLIFSAYETALIHNKCGEIGTKEKYSRSARGILQLGELQRSVLDAYMRPTCKHCRKKNPQCKCIVTHKMQDASGTTKSLLETSPDDGVSVREALHGMKCLQFYRRGKIQNEAWETVNLFNSYKAQLELVHLECAHSRHERKLCKFIREAWALSPLKDVSGDNIVYVIVSLYSRAWYIGQTGYGVLGRLKTHIRAWRSLSQTNNPFSKVLKLYQHFSKAGIERCIMMPINVWPDFTRKTVRMERENMFIYINNPTLNELGRSDVVVHKKEHAGEFMAPKRYKFRKVKRLVDLEKKKRVQHLLPKEKSSGTKNDNGDCLLQKHETIKVVTRLARRPFKADTVVEDLSLFWRLRKKTGWQLARLFSVVTQVLQGPSRNIALKNMTTLVRGRCDFGYAVWACTSPLFAVPVFAKMVKRKIREWLHSVGRLGIVLVTRFRQSIGASKSLLMHFENTGLQGQKEFSELRCTCHEERFSSFKKVQGHILMPLSEYLVQECGPIPHGWDARSKIVPNFEKEKMVLTCKAQTLHGTVTRKLRKMGHLNPDGLLPPLAVLNEEWIPEVWEKQTEHKRWVQFDEKLEKMQDKLRDLTVCPLDKYKKDGMICCPHKWGEATRELTKEYEELSLEEYQTKLQAMFHSVRDVADMPYVGYKKALRHRFGTLRLWLKAKSVTEIPADWSLLKWRPMVSYSKHHFRNLLSFLSRFVTYVMGEFELGFNCMDPVKIVDKANKFNFEKRTFEKANRVKCALNWAVYDIKEFFTKVSRQELMDTLQEMVERIKTKFPQKRFFCVSKETSTIRLDEHDDTKRWRKREQKRTKLCFMSKKVTRRENGIDVNNIMLAASIDYDFDLIWVLNRPMRGREGLAIGSPYAATGAALVASRREQRLLDSMQEKHAKLLKKHFFVSRWQDDALFVWYVHRKLKEAVAAIRTMQQENFYGNKLYTERDYRNEAYGFKVYNNQEELVLTCKSRFNRLPSQHSWVKMDTNTHLNVGKHYGPEKLIRAELMGILFRAVDMTNAPRPLMIQILIRLVAECILQGVPRETLKSCLQQLIEETGEGIPQSLTQVLTMSSRECEKIAVNFDQLVRDMDNIEITTQKTLNP